ncbi:MAG: [FeFe] hydrogenase H-cluster radical SAM maturase HydE [Planctomycetes bacterium]|nr:[FeFe] hydrogenase H-cluster radical SAM maturase HydE [Planctomycetota bacterium]
MTRDEIGSWLRQTDPGRLESLWRRADDVRRQSVGDAVYLRGLIEISNHCSRRCLYCGVRADRRKLPRYRMTVDEILASARQAATLGYGTVVLQSGEDWGLETVWLADVVRRIKAQTSLAVTLSLGERTDEELALWREAGADRYLLRFETSNTELFARIHPPRAGSDGRDRPAVLRALRRLGYEVGSGVMVGIPGQSYDDLARDIELFAELDLDMIGLGPFIAHPDTPLGRDGEAWKLPAGRQVPADELTACKAVALARMVCPRANIPSTTALATLNAGEGRQLGLARGGNVIMPNLTPHKYRALYEIYPGKACCTESDEFDRHLKACIVAMGRTVDAGRGDSLVYLARQDARRTAG